MLSRLSLILLSFGQYDEYQSCYKFYDLPARKISDLSDLGSQSYGQDTAALFSENCNSREVETEFFDHLNHRIRL